MNDSGQQQTVPQEVLEKKVGKKLDTGEQFTTATGLWRVVKIGSETYTVEKL